MINAHEKPNRIPWPPLLYGGFGALAILLQFYIPLPWPMPAMAILGSLLFLAGLATDLGTMLLFVKRKANILPHKAATRLITDGPFRFSRNPIYVGNTLMLAGAGLGFSSLWLLIAAALAALATHHLAILREEAHLKAKFGAEWEAYAARTPRWLLF